MSEDAHKGAPDEAQPEAAPPPPSPAEQIAIALEEIREILPSAVTWGDDGPTLDLDTFTRLLIQRGIDYRLLNRELSWAELGMVRAEQNTQRAIATQVETHSDDMPRKEEASRRLEALRERERVILEQLWPLP